MELQDIIKNDNDRLFILDNECFMIFTGDTIDDEKPFIRIGTWTGLPAQCIPLIENIVITDNITGNPANEQFNINPRNTAALRYIGSKNRVAAYLNFQNFSGLDLSGATSICVEDDLPVLSHEKIVFNKESIIGVFYQDGNFKVVYNGADIFELNDIEKKSITGAKAHEMVSETGRAGKMYGGAGLVMVENCMLFYKGGFFVSYQFPKIYLRAFAELRIDPFQIREMMLPAPNMNCITEYLKWKNSKGARIKIFADSKEGFDGLKALFPRLDIVRKDFSGLSINTGDGLVIRNIDGTINISLAYLNIRPSYKDIRIVFMKEYSGLNKIIEEAPDGIFIPYSVYEQAAMFLKSAGSPIAVIAGERKNISRLAGGEVVILHPGIQYEFKKYDNLDGFLLDAAGLTGGTDLVSEIIGNENADIEDILFSSSETMNETGFDRTRKALNTASALKIYLNTTTDRKSARQIMNGYQKALSLVDRNAILDHDRSAFRITLAFFDGHIYEFIELNSGPGEADAGASARPEIFDDPVEMLKNSAEPEGKALHERIMSDRGRLNDLLELYKQSRTTINKDIKILDTDLAERKKLSETNGLEINSGGISKRILIGRLKKLTKISAVILAAVLIALASYTGYNYYTDYREKASADEEKTRIAEAEKKRIEDERLKAEKRVNEKEDLIKKYDIRISDRDIFVYANKVALKNGYKKIEYSALKKKNPNWIYPGNVFRMMDGQKTTVKYGDTLWDLSEKKLMYLSTEFYSLIERIKKAKQAKKDYKDLVKKAGNFAFNSRHYKILDDVKK